MIQSLGESNRLPLITMNTMMTRTILLAACAFFAHSTCHAAIVTVTTTLDNIAGSLRWAVAQAYSGDTIQFAPDVRGTITLESGVIASQSPKDLNIEGPGPEQLAISGNKHSRILSVPGQINISGLTFKKSKTGFAIVLDAGQGGIGTVSNCHFVSNKGTAAVSVAEGRWYMYDCIFTKNVSNGTKMILGNSNNATTDDIQLIGAPALLIGELATLYAYRSQFISNLASGSRGGAVACGGTLNAFDCTFDGNSAKIGGALFVNGGGVYLEGCTLSANRSSGAGGAIAQKESTTNVNRCTFYANRASIGGGVYASTFLDLLYFDSCTVAMNRGRRVQNGGGGGIYSAGTFVSIKNSIIAQNTALSGPKDIDAFVISQDGNLVGNSNGTRVSEWRYADIIGTKQFPIDPKLDILRDNGGYTATAALLFGSPAIDKGVTDESNNLVDQRGATRVVDVSDTQNAVGGDGRDMGAFEFEGAF